MTDFLQIYASSRCVAHHHDPYRPGELMAFYQADTAAFPARRRVPPLRLIVFIAPNLPTTLFLIAPLAALPWKLAVVLWMALIAAAFILACFCVWNLGAESAPRLYGALIFLVLINSGLLLSTGNTAGLVVSLSVIAVWCFLQERFVPAGIVCLAIALAMKPHDAGPDLALLSPCRRRAPQARPANPRRHRPHRCARNPLDLARRAALGPGTPCQPGQAIMSRGGLDDPGPPRRAASASDMIISLQAILSLFRDDARLLQSHRLSHLAERFWPSGVVKTLRSRYSPALAWFALAAVVPLAMLPVYHRTYDARLLLLTVPACAMLWKKGGPARRVRARCSLSPPSSLQATSSGSSSFSFTHYSGPSCVLA